MIRKVGVVVFALYALLILYLSLAPSSGEPLPINDKVAHTLAYFGFAMVAIGLRLSRTAFLAACLCIVVYSGALELGQHFVPGRQVSILDFAANILGVLLGALASRLMPSVFFRLKQP